MGNTTISNDMPIQKITSNSDVTSDVTDASAINSGVLISKHGGLGESINSAIDGSILFFDDTGVAIISEPSADGEVVTALGGSPQWADAATHLGGFSDVTSAAQTPNLVLATPDGAGGAYLGRQLVVNDIPDLPASKITSGTLPTARGGTGADLSVKPAGEVLYTDGSGGVATLPVGNNGNYLLVSGGVPSWGTISASGMPEDLLVSVNQETSGSYSPSYTINLPSLTGYRRLRIWLSVTPNSNSWLDFRINGDSSGVYNYRLSLSQGGGHVLANQTNMAQIPLGWFINTTVLPSTQFAEVTIDNIDYSMGNYLSINSIGISRQGQEFHIYGTYNVATPLLTSLYFTTSATAWRVYSFYVYGVK